MRKEEVFSVFDRFHIMFNSNIDADGHIRLRNELITLSDQQYNNLKDLYYSEHFKPDNINQIFNGNKIRYTIYVKEFATDKTKINDQEVNQLILESQSNQNFLISKKLANEVILDYLESNNFKYKPLDEAWLKSISQYPKQDLINKITSCYVNSSDSLKKEDIIQIYKEFEDIILIEKDITDELNKFIRLNSLFPENEKLSLRYPKSYLIVTNWKKKNVKEEEETEPDVIYHTSLSKVAQFIVAKKHASYGLIASNFRELNDYDITNILRQLKELNIISSNDNLLIKNQSDLNRIFQQYKIQYTPFVIPPIVYPPILPLLFQTLTQVFKNNNEEKLLKTDIEKIYKDYLVEQTQDEIEKNINDFINSNNLVPENDKLEGKSYKEKQCSTNWIVKKKPDIVFPPPGCGKYLGYGILLALIAIGIYYGLPLLNSGTAYYNISSSANIRSTPNKSSTGNAIAELKYGEVFKSSKSVSDGSGTIWYKSNSWFTDEYVSSKLMVNEKDFYLLESIFGDEITKNTILTFKPRKALIDYYKRQDPEYKFFGKIDDITYKKVYGKPKDFTGEWQVFCYDFVDRVPNSIIYPRAFNSKSNFTDFGFIVTNISANIKRFVLYTFDDITEEPIYVGEADATGHNLVNGVKVRDNGTLDVNYADY
jgi:hypothetical protein